MQQAESTSRLECSACGATYPEQSARTRCTCGGLLSVEHDFTALQPAVLLRSFDQRRRGRAPADISGVWRYRELIGHFEHPITRPEGNTNLYAHRSLNAWSGSDNLLLKHEGENPTGSFKDRGMTAGVSQAVRAGARAVVCASTGNTSSSLASYAALAGLPAVVLVPYGKIAGGKLAQTIAYGARVVQIQGDFDVALGLAQGICDQMGLYLLNSINPWRLEGQKAIIFEMLQQLDWSVPDWIVVPGGNLGNTSAFGKALRELLALGIIHRSPKLAVIQAANADPFTRAFRTGFRRFEPVGAHTVATAINIGNPANYPRARRAVEETNGIVDEVSDAEILEAKAIIDRSGIGCEPASAATLAGVRKLVHGGAIARGESIVGILTGHLLKDPETTVSYHTQHGWQSAVVDATPAAVMRALEGIHT